MAFIQAISESVAESLRNNPVTQQAAPPPQYTAVEVIRTNPNGQKYRQKTNVPQLLAELCDRMEVIQSIAVDFDEDQYVPATKKRRRR